MRRWLKRGLLTLVTVWLAIFLFVAGFIQFFETPAPLNADATIIVLGSGQKRDGTPGHNTTLRPNAGLAIHQPGQPFVVSGGKLVHERQAVATGMADLAARQGVTALAETRSLSTLQNALYSADLMGMLADDPVILVTQRFHLPRAWASFYWAGFREITLYPADTAADHWQQLGWAAILSESIKAPLNLGRALVSDIAGIVGAPASFSDWLLQ